MGGEDDETCTHTLSIAKILLILHLHIPNLYKRGWSLQFVFEQDY